MKRHTITLLSLAIGSTLAQSAQPLKMELALFQVKVVTENGKAVEKFVPSTTSLPGDTLSQVLTVRNTGRQAVRNAAVNLAIPKNTQFLEMEKGMTNARVLFSIDGGKTFAPAPLFKKVTVTENGKTVTKQVEVKPNEYQAVKWIIPEINSGASVKVGYRIRVK